MQYSQWLQQFCQLVASNEYLFWHPQVSVLSVFDDVRYDRADIDILSPAMRRFASDFLMEQGFYLKSGRCLYHRQLKFSCWLPKPSVLAASSFDICRYQKRLENDFYLLTPTQSAAYLLDNISMEEAVDAIAAMIKLQPINILKLEDMISSHSSRHEYTKALGHLKFCQRQSQNQASMKFKRSLGSVF